jgi:hypothetical protein
MKRLILTLLFSATLTGCAAWHDPVVRRACTEIICALIMTK